MASGDPGDSNPARISLPALRLIQMATISAARRVSSRTESPNERSINGDAVGSANVKQVEALLVLFDEPDQLHCDEDASPPGEDRAAAQTAKRPEIEPPMTSPQHLIDFDPSVHVRRSK